VAERRETLNDIKEDVDTYIPVRQVAKEMSVNKAYIFQEIKEGHLRAYDLGGYKIKRSELVAYIEARKVLPVSK
jgi:excisionase family DNA binding protein